MGIIKIKNKLGLVSVLFMVLTFNYFDLEDFENKIDKNIHYKNKEDKLSLDDAKILLLMKVRGRILNSHIIRNLENIETYIITIEREIISNNEIVSVISTFLIEQTGEIELIEEFKNTEVFKLI